MLNLTGLTPGLLVSTGVSRAVNFLTGIAGKHLLFISLIRVQSPCSLRPHLVQRRRIQVRIYRESVIMDMCANGVKSALRLLSKRYS